MGIPNDQLERWSRHVDHISAQKSHLSIRDNLQLLAWPDSWWTDYLQGSYRNHTNVRASSDVDIVVQIEPQGYLDEFRQDVLSDLRGSYGVVKEGNKSIKVRMGSVNADVVVCEKLKGGVEGIRFFTHKENPRREIRNYPKLHIRNGEIKNQDTGGVYKPTVRIFKNMRNRLVEEGKLDERTAPSYFMECLLYNVPDSSFINVCDCTVLNALSWFINNVESDELKCQCLPIPLYGPSPEKWSKPDAIKLVLALWGMWTDWGK